MAIDRSIDTIEARRNGLPKTTGSLAPVPGRCGAQLRYTGDLAPNPGPMYPAKYCMTTPMRGKRRCRQHGGKTPVGIASPKYASGQGLYGPSLRAEVQTVYHNLLESDELLSMRDEIAVAKAWLQDIVGRVRLGQTPSAPVQRDILVLKAQFEKLRRAIAGGKKEQFTTSMRECGVTLDALAEGMEGPVCEREAMAEFRRWALVLEKLEARENQREEDSLNRLSAEKAFALRAAEQRIFLGAILEFVQDVSIQNAIRRRVATELAVLTPRRDSPRVAAGRGPGEGAAEDPASGDAGATRGLLQGHAGADVSE